MNKAVWKKRLPFLLICIGLLLTMCNVYYADLNTNMRQGMNFWRALCEHDLLHYYSVNMDSLHAGEMQDRANYGMFVNLINAVWMLPLYIAERIKGSNILDVFAARLWGKLFLALLLGLSVRYVEKIAVLLKFDERRRTYLKVLYVCSPLVLMSVCQASQLDILGLLFCLIAVYRILKEDKKGFFLFFTFAVLSKNLPFLILLPVLLLFEKNLCKILGIMVGPFLIDKLMDLPFQLADPAGAHTKGSRLWIMIDFLARSRVNLVGGIEIPVVFLAMGVLCMWAYLKVPAEMPEEKKRRTTILLASVGMLPMLLLTKSNAYWCIYAVPFCLLLILQRGEKLFLRIVLERAAAMCLTVAYMVHDPWYYGMVDGMLPSFFMRGISVEDMPVCEMIGNFFTQEKYFYFWTLSYAAYMVWVIGYIYYEFRAESAKKVVLSGDPRPWIDGTQGGLRLLVIFAAIGGFVLCNLYAFLTVIAAWVGMP